MGVLLAKPVYLDRSLATLPVAILDMVQLPRDTN